MLNITSTQKKHKYKYLYTTLHGMYGDNPCATETSIV